MLLQFTVCGVGIGSLHPRSGWEMLLVVGRAHPTVMPFQGLQSLLRQIERQYQSPTQRHWRSLVAVWPIVMGEKLAAQTRPTNIRAQILQVAVANPVLVQTLMFSRSGLLKKLLAQLADRQIELTPETTITDIRFSTAGWHQPTSIDSPYNQFNSWDQHPCNLPAPIGESVMQVPYLSDPTVVFQRWSERMRVRDQALPTCPQCSAPALSSELDRWGYCSLCYSQSQMPRPDSTLAATDPAPSIAVNNPELTDR
jgi:predicted nucleic acid-binding Zn ribbon protein